MDIVIFRKKAGRRLKQFIIEKGTSKSVFAESIGVTLPTLSKVITRGGGMSSEMVYNIFDVYPELNWNWVFKGVGNMLDEKKVTYNTKDYEQIGTKPVDVPYNAIGNNIYAIENLHKIIEEKDKHIASLQERLSEVQNDKKRLYQDKERLWELLEQKKG